MRKFLPIVTALQLELTAGRLGSRRAAGHLVDLADAHEVHNEDQGLVRADGSAGTA